MKTKELRAEVAELRDILSQLTSAMKTVVEKIEKIEECLKEAEEPKESQEPAPVENSDTSDELDAELDRQLEEIGFLYVPPTVEQVGFERGTQLYKPVPTPFLGISNYPERALKAYKRAYLKDREKFETVSVTVIRKAELIDASDKVSASTSLVRLNKSIILEN